MLKVPARKVVILAGIHKNDYHADKYINIDEPFTYRLPWLPQMKFILKDSMLEP